MRFKELLILLQKSGMISIAQLAQSMGVSEGVIEDMIRLLVARGYLRESTPESCEPSACGTCAHSAQCVSDVSSAATYTITEKGIEFAKA